MALNPVASYKPQISKDTAGTSYNYVGGLYNSNVEINLQALSEISKMGPGQAVAQGYLSEVLRLLGDDSIPVKCAALGAVGTMGEAVDLEKVVALLEDESIEVQCAAIVALGTLGPYAAEYAGEVVVFLATEYPTSLRAAATMALGTMKAASYTDEIKSCLKDADTTVVKAACGAVAALEEDGQLLVGEVASCLTHASSGVKTAAAEALAKAGGAGEKQAEAVAALLSDEDNMCRLAALEFFETAGTAAKKAAPKVAAGLSAKDSRFLAASAMALGYMKASKYAKEVSALLGSPAVDSSVALSASGVEKKLPTVLRRPGCAAAMALAMMGDAGAAFSGDIAKGLEGDAPTEVVVCTVKALGLIGKGPEAKIIDMLKDTAAPVREAACFALGAFDKAGSDVAKRLQDPHPGVRAAAASAIGKMKTGGPPLAGEVAKLFSDKVAKVKIAAVKAIGALGKKAEFYATEVCCLASSGETSVRVAALNVLGDMGDHGAALAEDVVGMLGDPEASVREAALKALSKMGDEALAFISEIKVACCDPLETVRAAADDAAEKLTAPPATST